MTVITLSKAARDLPEGATPVAEAGLLSRVQRPCPEHAGECACIARDAEAGCLVFWCETGEHHFSNR